MTECGLPDGVFNVVPGQGECGAALSGHEDLDMVDLTGGTPTGRKVHEVRKLEARIYTISFNY